ncbi:MAG: signal peptidase I [Myxococcota bacterium]
MPSGSMIPTLLVGDFIFVSKFTYGLQLPFSDYTFFAWRKPERGEVIIFEHPLPAEDDEILIKRVVAVAGDTVRLTNNIWMVGADGAEATPLGEPAVINRRTECRLSPGEECRWYIQDDPSGEDHPGCPCTLQRESSDKHDWITQHVAPNVVCECSAPHDSEQRGYSKHANSPHWPAPVPFFREGNDFLRHWPKAHRATALSKSADGLPQVTIPEGYIMVMGDNRDHSSDGRYWGLVPLNKVRGKAMFMWLRLSSPFSRMFRRVH